MNINYIVLGLMALVAGFFTWKSYTRVDDSMPSMLPWVPIKVGKERSFVNQTRDAGMFTERQRRVAIIGSNGCGLGMKSPFQKHFSNGVMETFLTGICAVPIFDVVTPLCTIFDGMSAAELGGDVPVYSGGDASESDAPVVDAGDASTNVCDE